MRAPRWLVAARCAAVAGVVACASSDNVAPIGDSGRDSSAIDSPANDASEPSGDVSADLSRDGLPDLDVSDGAPDDSVTIDAPASDAPTLPDNVASEVSRDAARDVSEDASDANTSVNEGGCGLGGSVDTGVADGSSGDGPPAGTLGGPCDHGWCEPGLVCTPLPQGANACLCPTANCGAVQVAVGGRGVRYLAIDAQYLYWGAGDGISDPVSGIRRAPLIGGPAEVLFDGYANSIAVTRSVIYFDTRSTIYSVPLSGLPDGGTPKFIGAGLGSIDSSPGMLYVAGNDTSAYASGDAIGSPYCVTKFPASGLPPGGYGECVGGIEPHFHTRVLVDDSGVYWASASAIHTASLDGSTKVTLHDATLFGYSSPARYLVPLASDASFLYTVDDSTGNGANVVRISKSTGEETVIARSAGTVAAIAVDGTRVYWAESHYDYFSGVLWTDLRAAPLAPGCSPVLLAQHFSYAVSDPGLPLISDIVVDPANIYWATMFEGIWRLAK